MSAAYIIAERGKLTKEGRHLVFQKYDGTKSIIQMHKIDSIMMIGNVSITGEALHLISDSEMPVVIAESNGMFRCVIEYQTSKNVFLHQKQFRIYEDEQTKLNIAKSIVKGKIRNQMSFVQRINRKGNKPDEKELDGIIKNLKKFYALSEYAKSIEQLRGYEGCAAKLLDDEDEKGYYVFR